MVKPTDEARGTGPKPFGVWDPNKGKIMKSYVLELVNSGGETEILAETEKKAIAMALEIIGQGAISAENWDTAAPNDDGEPCKRLLIWDDAELADNDPGQHAVAQLVTIGEP